MPSATDPEETTRATPPGSSAVPGTLEGHAERLGRALGERTARVGVIGLGYVGLPLVELFAAKGFPVLGLDIDVRKVERLLAGESYIGHIGSDRVAGLLDSGRFEASADFA